MSNATAVGLVRVSTEGQVSSGLGLEAQRSAIEAFAARQGITIARWVSEEAVSGGRQLSERPELLEALLAVRELGAKHLLVACIDRLARSVLTVELVHAELARAGATLLSADGSTNGSDPESKLMRTIVAAMAEFERSKIALRTRAALKAKIARGEPVGPKPFGRDDRERAALRRLEELITGEGVCTNRQIAKQLTEEGHRTRRGGEIDHTWVSRKARTLGDVDASGRGPIDDTE